MLKLEVIYRNKHEVWMKLLRRTVIPVHTALLRDFAPVSFLFHLF